MKKILTSLVLVLALVFPLASLAEGVEGLLPLEAAVFEEPILLTSVGQSADVNIVDTLLKKIGIEARLGVSVTAEEVANYKTLVLAVGGSSKGLGAAGVDEKQELERVVALIEAAKENDVKILALHIGGQARRGVLSDLFIPDAVHAADAMIVVEAGDVYDGLAISELLLADETPAAYVKTQIDVLEPLKLVFGK